MMGRWGCSAALIVYQTTGSSHNSTAATIRLPGSGYNKGTTRKRAQRPHASRVGNGTNAKIRSWLPGHFVITIDPLTEQRSSQTTYSRAFLVLETAHDTWLYC